MKENQENSGKQLQNEMDSLSDKIVHIQKTYCLDMPSVVSSHTFIEDLVHFLFPIKDNKLLCWMKIKQSDKEIFLKIYEKDYFFIRVDAETRQISDKALVDYCTQHFNKKETR